MNKASLVMVFCVLFSLSFFINASGTPDSEFRTIPIDLELTNISERDMFSDPSSGFFVFMVLGEGQSDELGDFSYASNVSLEPSEPHSICGEGDLSSSGLGSSFVLIPGKGVLKLEISECNQCMNLGTGLFRSNQTEVVVQGSGALEGATGEWTLDVEGRLGAGQKIHITGELKIPVN